MSPAGALSKVTATDAGGLTFVATPDAAGAFSIKDLQPGSYTLTFAPATGYTAPADRSITIVAGQNVGAGTVSVDLDGSIRSGTVTWTVDGRNYVSTTPTGSVTPSNGFRPDGKILNLTADATSGNSSERVIFTIDYLRLIASSYPLGVFTMSLSTYLAFYSRGIIGSSGQEFRVTTGTLAVSSYDPNARILIGTFDFVAQGTGTTTGTVHITNGTFRLQL